MEGVAVGRIVHFVPPGESAGPRHLAAMIVRVWVAETGYVNLTVFPDWGNDKQEYAGGDGGGISWETSVYFSAEPKPRTWHWPERT